MTEADLKACSCGEMPKFFSIANLDDETLVDIGFVCGCGYYVELTIHELDEVDRFTERLAKGWNEKWQS